MKSIDPEEESKRLLFEILNTLKRETKMVIFLVGVVSISGFLLVGLLDVFFKQNILRLFLSIIFIYISFFSAEILVSSTEGKIHTFYKLMTIGGLILSYVSGANIGVSVMLFGIGFIYFENNRLLMRRVNRTMKNFFFELPQSINMNQALNSYEYIYDRLQWNRITCFLTLFLTSLGYVISLFLNDTRFSDTLETLAIVIIVFAVVPRLFMKSSSKSIQNIVEEQKRVFKLAYNVDH